MRQQNAVVESASIFIEDHGILTSNLLLRLEDGFRQSFGGYNLTGEYLARWVKGVFAATGVSEWSQVVGRPIRIRKGEDWNDLIDSLGHFLDDDKWFSPRTEWSDQP